jgi:hypothetical protein
LAPVGNDRIRPSAIARDCGDDAVCVNFANASKTANVPDIQVASNIRGDAAGWIQAGVSGCAPVTGGTPARYRPDDRWVVGAVELPLVTEWTSPIHRDAEIDARSRHDGLTGWLSGNRGANLAMEVHGTPGQSTGDQCEPLQSKFIHFHINPFTFPESLSQTSSVLMNN